MTYISQSDPDFNTQFRRPQFDGEYRRGVRLLGESASQRRALEASIGRAAARRRLNRIARAAELWRRWHDTPNSPAVELRFRDGALIGRTR